MLQNQATTMTQGRAEIVKLLFNVTLKLLVLRRTFKVNLRLMSCQQLGSYSSSLTPFRLIFNRLSSVSRLSDELIIRSKELQLYYQYSKHHTRLNVSRKMLLSSESHGAKVGNLLCKQTSPKWSYIRFCFSPISPAAAAASAGMRQRDSCHRLIPLLTFRLRDFPSCKFFLRTIIGETKN